MHGYNFDVSRICVFYGLYRLSQYSFSVDLLEIMCLSVTQTWQYAIGCIEVVSPKSNSPNLTALKTSFMDRSVSALQYLLDAEQSQCSPADFGGEGRLIFITCEQ